MGSISSPADLLILYRRLNTRLHSGPGFSKHRHRRSLPFALLHKSLDAHWVQFSVRKKMGFYHFGHILFKHVSIAIPVYDSRAMNEDSTELFLNGSFRSVIPSNGNDFRASGS